MNLLQRVSEVISEKNLIGEGDRVLVAVSGGPDSVCLFHILYEIKEQKRFDLFLAHINHGLRGDESLRDEDFVRKLAERHRVRFHVERVDVKKYALEHGLSLQQAARTLRYKSLFFLADEYGYEKIAVGHNMDDQVETFLLRLVKGTGIRGLKSIPIMRGKIIRPLLPFQRREIEDYLREKKIEYVEDSSNRDPAYERNYLRCVVLPLLSRINPRFREKIVALLHDLTFVNEMFDQRAKEFFDLKVKFDNHQVSSSREELKNLDHETRFRVLAHMVSYIDCDVILQRKHANLIESILFSPKPSSSVRLPSGICAETVYGDFFLKRISEQKPIEGPFPLKEGENLLQAFSIKVTVSRFLKSSDFSPHTENPLIAHFDADKTKNLEVRTFREGDRFIPLGMRDEIKVKDFFIKRKVPKGERRRIPILTSDGRIVWIVGHRIDERFKVTEETNSVLRIECEYLRDPNTSLLTYA